MPAQTKNQQLLEWVEEWRGILQPEAVEWIEEFFRPLDIFYDIGADLAKPPFPQPGRDIAAEMAVDQGRDVLSAIIYGSRMSLLVGLLGNALVGAWWLDPLVGLLIAGVAVQEGREAPGARVGGPARESIPGPFTPLAEGLDNLGLTLCTTPDCDLTPP